MKTVCIITAIVMAALGRASAQDVATDVAILNKLTEFHVDYGMNSTELKNVLNNLLTEAKNQVQRLDDQLARTGDYAAANYEGVTSAMTAVEATVDPSKSTLLKTSAELGAIRNNVTGAEVFTEAVEGVFTPIGAKFTAKDGTEKDRSAATYKPEALALTNIKEYERIRNAAILRQQELSAARIQAHMDLLEAPDEVATQRLTALIGTLDADLIAVGQDIANASTDLQNQDRANALQSSVDAKARSEETSIERGRRMTPAEIQAALLQLPNGGRTGTHNTEARVPFGPTTPTPTPGVDITDPE